MRARLAAGSEGRQGQRWRDSQYSMPAAAATRPSAQATGAVWLGLAAATSMRIPQEHSTKPRPPALAAGV